MLDERAAAPRDDILSLLTTAEAGDERLTRDEMLDICFVLLTAGLDTVTDSLTCFWAFLAQHPDHQRQLVEHPEVIPDAVEELLRWETPVPAVVRWAREDHRVGEHPVGAGHLVMANLSSANVDPEQLPGSARRPLRPRRSTATSPSAAASIAASVHTSRAASCASRCAEWHRRIPEYSLAPGYTVAYKPPLRFVPDLAARLADGPLTAHHRRNEMEDVLGYRDASVVVTGAASGMGAATAQILVDLGAQVTAIDIKPTEVAVSRFVEVDLRDRAAIDDAVASIGEPVNNLFSCAGLPGPPFSELDTMLVNFVGARHLAEGTRPEDAGRLVDLRDLVVGRGRLAGPDGDDRRAPRDRRLRRGRRVVAGARGVVVLERLPVLEVGRRRVGRLVVSRPRRRRASGSTASTPARPTRR